MPFKHASVPAVPAVRSPQAVESLDPLPTPPAFEIAATLQSLTTVAQNLNELSDRLTAQVLLIERAVNKLNLGVRTTVDVDSSLIDNDDFSALVTRLGYTKVDGKWGFAIHQFVDIDPENTYQTWAFKDAPRDLRLKAVDRIPELMKALVDTSVKLGSDINDKICLTKGLVSALSQTSPAGSER
jgi:hypothetical protein